MKERFIGEEEENDKYEPTLPLATKDVERPVTLLDNLQMDLAHLGCQ